MVQRVQRKIVVTGGAGFIGSHIVDALVGRGDEVHVVDNAKQLKNHNSAARYHCFDVCDIMQLTKICEGADVIFHHAANPRVETSFTEPFATFMNNVVGTATVLEVARSASVRRVVYAASSSAYGDQGASLMKEGMLAQPMSPYARQKYMGEQLLQDYARMHGVETVSLRYFNVYGPRLDPDGPYALVVGKFLQQRKDCLPITITGDGFQTRDFVHVFDVVRANLLAADKNSVGRGEVINIGTGNAVSINDIANHIGGQILYVPARTEPRNTRADVSLASTLLNWEPSIEIKEGISLLKQEWKLN